MPPSLFLSLYLHLVLCLFFVSLSPFPPVSLFYSCMFILLASLSVFLHLWNFSTFLSSTRSSLFFRLPRTMRVHFALGHPPGCSNSREKALNNAIRRRPLDSSRFTSRRLPVAIMVHYEKKYRDTKDIFNSKRGSTVRRIMIQSAGIKGCQAFKYFNRKRDSCSLAGWLFPNLAIGMYLCFFVYRVNGTKGDVNWV